MSIPHQSFDKVVADGQLGVVLHYAKRRKHRVLELRFTTSQLAKDCVSLLQKSIRMEKAVNVEGAVRINRVVQRHIQRAYILAFARISRVDLSRPIVMVGQTGSTTTPTTGAALMPSSKARPNYTSKLFAMYMSSKLDSKLRSNVVAGLHRMEVFARDSVQTDTLKAAEGLAALNEEILDGADRVPIERGIVQLSKLVLLSDLRLKFMALTKLKSH